MTIDFPDDLIGAQQAADAAYARLLELQERFSNPSGADQNVPPRDWTAEQREEWETQQQEWRRLGEVAQAAVTAHAEAAGLSRFEVEAALRTAVRHPQSEDG